MKHLKRGGEFMANHSGAVHANSGWVVGFASFAAIVMAISGVFQFFEGLAAILNGNYFIVGNNYAFHLDATTWGWIHLIIGAVVTIAGFSIFSRSSWGRIVGIILASIAAIANFFYIPYAPVWSILIIALDIAVIFALCELDTSEFENV